MKRWKVQKEIGMVEIEVGDFPPEAGPPLEDQEDQEEIFQEEEEEVSQEDQEQDLFLLEVDHLLVVEIETQVMQTDHHLKVGHLDHISQLVVISRQTIVPIDKLIFIKL